MLFLCAWLLNAMLALGAATRAPSLALDHDGLRAAPVVVGIATAPAPPAHKQPSSFPLSRDVDVSVITLLKSLGGAAYYRLGPGVALGAGSSVATLDSAGGPLHALQLVTVLRFKF